MPLNPNDTLLNGQYRILRLLGRGGFGFVYQAQDTLLHKEIAIKELIPALVGDDAMLKRFLVEARATMELTHDRIVRTHNIFQEGGNYYIAMECMSGGSLEELLEQKALLPVDEAVRIAVEVCEGLDYAHQRGIVHCDLKPANILFTADGTAKVADFGIAHVSDQMLSRSWMTPAGFVAGTLPYMSPEQADGVRADPRVDVYALGAALYRLLTGRTYLDFDQRETPGAQADNVYRIRNAKPVAPSTHNRRIPAWLDAVVLKALSKRPEERYGSASEMQAALERRSTAVPVPPKVEAAPAPPRQRPAHRPAWFWPAVGAAGVLLIAVVAVLVMLFGGGTGSPETPTTEPTQVAVVEPALTSTLTPTRGPALINTTEPPTVTPTRTDTPQPTSTPAPSPIPASAGPGRIAFTSNRDGNLEVYVMNADGSGQTRLTNNPASDGRPAWSPDGARITFDSDRDGNLEVYVMNADGSGQTRLTNNPTTDGEPAWSPDGTRITFTSDRDGNAEIYVMNADGSGVTRLTNSGTSKVSSAWSPDRTRIAFQSFRDRTPEIYVMNADGSGVTRLSDDLGYDLAPAWSPDGTRIAFHSYREKNLDIYVMNADGSGQIRLGRNAFPAYSPAWSPDGRHIAFDGNRDENYDIYVMNVDGSEVMRLTNHPGADMAPAWSP